MCNWFQNKSPTHTFAVDWDTWHGNWAAPCYFNGALPTGSARWGYCLQRHLACEGLYFLRTRASSGQLARYTLAEHARTTIYERKHTSQSISYCREISKESSQQATSLIWNGNTSHDRTRSCICYVSCLFEFNDNWSNIHIRGIDTMRFWYPNGWAPIILKVFRTPKLEGRWCRVKTNLSFNSGIDWYKCVVLI